MKGFKKLSSIVVLLFAFVYPPLLAEAKASSLSNAPNEQNVATEANLVEGETGELLIAQRRYERRQFRRGQRYRRQQFRRQQYLRQRYRRQQFRRQGYRQRYRQRGYYGRPVSRPGIYIRL
ncbi:MAG: hypothetical protein KME55_31650 [Nostoc indistinguendum CM1-VF10]|nr:hypothetical protein [Nostoc indistinguendum CM1-VF10]